MRHQISASELEKNAKTIEPLTKGFDLISDHVVITDENANILYANKAVEQNTGFSRAEILGRNPADLWGNKMPKKFYEKMWQTIKVEKKPFVGEVQNIRKDGSRIWQELHITPILDEAGAVKFFVGIEPNIAGRKQKEQFRNEFVSIVGHQLHNPLTTMRWVLGWLLQGNRLTVEDRQKLEDVYKQDEELSNFVSALLALSHAEKVGNVPRDKEPLDLVVEVRQLIEEVKMHDPKVNFTFSSDEKSLPMSVDKAMVNQIFSNLIYNAAEYSDKNSGKVVVTLKKTNQNYLFSCYNNGLRIAESDKPLIFTKFFRSSKAIEIKKSGSGLGLLIVKTIADNLGWQVWFESNELGTTFYVKMS